STISNNQFRSGAGIANKGALTINRSTVADNLAEPGEGGGLFNDGGGVTINRSKFLRNQSQHEGGGIYSRKGSLSIDDTDITSNASGSGGGGGLFTTLSPAVMVNNVPVARVTLNNSRVRNNVSFAGPGGGINILESAVTISRSDISANVNVTGNGGGIFISQAGKQTEVKVSDSTVNDNLTDIAGGGIHVASGKVTVERSTVAHNATNGNPGRGGGINVASGTLDVTASTISDNRSKDTGGGINNALGTVTILASTISGNTLGRFGGGVCNACGVLQNQTPGTMTLDSSTVVSNTATLFQEGRGGGIVGSGVTLRNTVVALNSGAETGSESPPIHDISGTVNSQGYNLIGNMQGATVIGDMTGNLLNFNPILGPLQDNGGPTLTHAPLPGSPLIDAGRSTPAADQRGLGRKVDFPTLPNQTGGDGSDIGALELQPITISGVVNGAGGGVLLTLSGKQTVVTRTKDDGSYSFNNVPPGGTFTLTPSKPGFEFSPSSTPFANLLQSRRADFDATPDPDPSDEPDPDEGFDGATSPIFRFGLLSTDNATFNPNTAVKQEDSQLKITPPTRASETIQFTIPCGVPNPPDCTQNQSGSFLKDGSFEGRSFNGYVSNSALDLNVTTSVSVEVEKPVVGVGAQTLFSVGKDQNNFYGFRVVGTAPAPPDCDTPIQTGAANLIFEIVLGGSKTHTASVSYDPTKHRHWRIRFDAPASVVIFETSPDGNDWENPCPPSQSCRFPVGGAFTDVAAELIAGTDGRTNNPCTAVFDDYEVANPTGIGFDPTNFPASEKDRTIPLKLTRTGDVTSRAAVAYTLAGDDGTPLPGGTVTFPENESDATFTIQNPFPDDALWQPVRVLTVTLAPNPKGGALITDFDDASVVITDDEPAPTLSINDVSVTEGDAGTVNAAFAVTLSSASSQPVTVNYATADGTATAGSDYTAVTSTALSFAPGETKKNISVVVNGDTLDEPNETFFVNLSGATNATINDAQGVGIITDDDGPPSLSINDVTVTEGNAGTTNATFTVSLLPASGQTVTVNYATADGTATTADRDYQSASGALTFTPGQTSKTITVIVNGDTAFEEHENFFVNLSGETNANASDAQGQGTITDDDNFNKIDADPVFFTSQQYCDFLNRPPDPSGLNFWRSQFDHCATGAADGCFEREKVHVSSAFFFAIEFQQTGYFVIRAYQATFGRIPLRGELLPDARAVAGGVVVNQGEWEKELEFNKRDFLDAWVQRPAFKEKLGALDNGGFVDALYKNAGVALTPERRAELLLSLLTGQTTRRKIFGGLLDSKAPTGTSEAREADEFRRAHFNRAFVLMQYFGYLQRDPDDEGFRHWLDKLNQFNGDFAAAEMVKAFVNSDEYRTRFKNRPLATCVGP
ncbi:MAG TPA: Calx-beta domain-containing protein, partial [Pyrinomonadaceae bacterium]